jgi:hypothetical protein
MAKIKAKYEFYMSIYRAINMILTAWKKYIDTAILEEGATIEKLP